MHKDFCTYIINMFWEFIKHHIYVIPSSAAFDSNLLLMICCHSGTLSYVFNNFKGARLFSEVVAEAKQAGYTEPDPRDDLSGTDVARKVLQALIFFLVH